MPRRDILLDSSGNRVLIQGDYAFVDGVQAIEQGIRCRVLLWEGEVWLNQALGVPYATKILIHTPNPLVVKSEIASAIAATPDVTQVVNTAFSIDPQTRRATIDYTAATTAGTVSGSVTQ